jgi:predicted murein hydrolase (TIGR00659 family)
MDLNEWWNSPLFGISVTVIAYSLALQLKRKWSRVHPLLITSVLLIGLLAVSGIPYKSYQIGGNWIVILLGPATVALAVPLYKFSGKIKQMLLPIITSITLGAISGMGSVLMMVWLSGGTRDILLAMLPKSVTTPIAMEIVRQLGGAPELGAVFAVLTGFFGSMIGPYFLKLCGIRSDIAIGAAMGTSAHGIGTASVIAESQLQGGISAFSMACSGIITSVLFIPLQGWL